jgi:phage gp29-like protein
MAQILDQYGKPFNPAGMRSKQTDELAMLRSLESERAEHPARRLTPARIHQIFTEAENGDWLALLDLADDMEERDTQIYSEVAKRKNGVIKLDWDVVAPDDASALEQEQAEQIKAWISAIPQFKQQVVFPLLDGILKGFSAVEMVWKLDARQTLQPQFQAQPQRWFCQSEDRRQIHLRDTQAYGVPLRPYNWLIHKHPARSGYVARASLARVLVFPYLFKNYALRDLAEFLEIYGLPLRLGKYASGASDKEKMALLRAVTEIGHNAAGIIPLGMEIEFANAAQGTQVPFEAMLDRMDAAISKAIVGQTLTSGEGKHGTQALGNVHNEVRLDILAADAELIGETLSNQLIEPLALLNIAGMDAQRLPRFVIEVPEPEDIASLADSLPKLASAGVQIGEKWVRHKLRIPDLDAGEQPLKATAPKAQANESSLKEQGTEDAQDVKPKPLAKPDVKPAAKDAKDQSPPEKQALAMLRGMVASLAQEDTEKPQPSEPRDALDDLVDEATADWKPQLYPLVNPLLAELDAAIERGESAQSFADRLPGLLGLMNGKALGERVSRARFAAHLAGAADLNLETGAR